MSDAITIHAQHYATNNPVCLTIADGRIRSLSPSTDTAVPQASYVAPAFFDLQINGCLGSDFGSESLSADGMRTIVGKCRRHGIGAFCPTLITNAFENLRDGFRRLVRARAEDPWLARAMPCFHLEGPYLSPEDGPRGAHPRAHVRPPDWDEFLRLQEAADGMIRLVTLAPEWDQALRFMERLVNAGVVPAIGHTAATPQRLRDAIHAGARLSTHLGNGCHGMVHRHENHLWEQLAADELFASIICDGHHLPPALVKCILRCKTPGRAILTCDAGSLAGLPPGRYESWGQAFEVVPEGKIVVPGTPYLAGSWAFTDACVANVMRCAGVTLGEAIAMACHRPRELLGLPSDGMAVGASADLVLFDLNESGSLLVRGLLIDGSWETRP